MAQGRLIYVTGTPGTDVAKSLVKFRDWRVDTGAVLQQKVPHVIKLEDRLIDIATNDVKRCLNIDAPRGAKARLFDVLALPKPVLYQRWRHAFSDCLKEASRERKKSRDVFLTFHACWYHLRNREYISGIDFKRLLQKDAAADLMVTFIDDIYDVRSRLSMPRGVLEPQLSVASEIMDVVLKLLLILDWRAFEITLSERVADAACKGKHFLFAVKHPLRTLNALLYERRKRIYLSHHISQLRRMKYRTEKERTISDAAVRDIQAVAQKLRDLTVLFEPTTVDEARFDYRLQRGTSQAIIPKLGERWPLGSSEELAYIPPERPLPAFGDEWERKAEEVISSQNPDKFDDLEVSSALLHALSDKIFSQINSRDHFLVEHSDGIAVYRPYFLGYEASGVKEELEHHYRLVRAGNPRATAIVLHTPSDEQMRPRRMGQRCMEQWRKDNELVGENSGVDQLIEKLPDDGQFWKQINRSDPLSDGRLLREYVGEYGCRFRADSSSSPLGSAPALQQQDADENRGNEFHSWLHKNYLNQFGRLRKTLLIRKELTPETFAERVKDHLEK